MVSPVEKVKLLQSTGSIVVKQDEEGDITSLLDEQHIGYEIQAYVDGLVQIILLNS